MSELKFSPDGKLLAGADARGQIRVWDTTSRRPFGIPLAGYQNRDLRVVTFVADGSAVLGIDADSRVRIHPVDSAEIKAALCAEVGPLSQGDWRHYMPNLTYRKTC
ncbi:hypothetical protein ACQP1V_27410 [Microtetraspora malaysiensis]